MGIGILTAIGRKNAMERGPKYGDQQMILFTDPDDVDFFTVAGDLTEADFSGYAAQTLTWNGIDIVDTYKARCPLPTVRFQHDGGGVSNLVYGWAILGTYDEVGQLFAIKLFDEGPMTFASVGDFVDIDLTALLYQPSDP